MLPVLLAQAGLVLLTYGPAYNLAFVSDAWAYIHPLRQGTAAAIMTSIGYHWQPVACAWIALIRAIFGERPVLFQTVNLIELTAIGQLTYQLGRRLLQDSAAAFLGSLLFLGSAVYYEASYQPLAGNMHLLAALLYVLAMILAYDVASGRLAGFGPWLLYLTVLAAVFSHPAMVTSVVVCPLILIVIGRRRPQEMSAEPRRLQLTLLLPFVAVAALFAASRLWLTPLSYLAPKPGLEWMRMYILVRKGLIGLFTGRASPLFIDPILDLGTHTQYPAQRLWFFVAGWLMLAILVGAYLLWRAPSPGVRILVAFLAAHLAALTLAVGISSRQSVLPSVSASLLTVWAFRAAAKRLAARATFAPAVTLAQATPALAVALLIAAAQRDHYTARKVHLRAADASRSLVARLESIADDRGPIDLTLINMPASTAEHGIAAVVFANGLADVAHMVCRAVKTVDVRWIPIRTAPPNMIDGITLLSRTELRAQLSERQRVVLLYEDEPLQIRFLSLSDFDALKAP